MFNQITKKKNSCGGFIQYKIIYFYEKNVYESLTNSKYCNRAKC